jgi:hypothetical protein
MRDADPDFPGAEATITQMKREPFASLEPRAGAHDRPFGADIELHTYRIQGLSQSRHRLRRVRLKAAGGR